jgi:hypothetical protein
MEEKGFVTSKNYWIKFGWGVLIGLIGALSAANGERENGYLRKRLSRIVCPFSTYFKGKRIYWCACWAVFGYVAV